MKQRTLLPCIAFFALVLCCPALGAEAPESIEVTSGGVRYRLIVPEGYHHVPETSPEYAHFARLTRFLSQSQRVLAVFADEQSLGLAAAGAAEPKPKCLIACASSGNEAMTKAEFESTKTFFAHAVGRETLSREVKRNEKELGLPSDTVPTPALRHSPSEYIIMSSHASPNARGNAVGTISMLTVVDTRLLNFTFYDWAATADTLDDLAGKADAYARQYVDAGLVVFAPEAQSVARTESAGGAERPESIVVNAGGTEFRLLVPEGYRHVLEYEPEYEPFAESARLLEVSHQGLALFVDERTVRLLNGEPAPPVFKYIIACTPRVSMRNPTTKNTFLGLRRMMQYTADRSMPQGSEPADERSGTQNGTLRRLLLETPEEYALTSAILPLSGMEEKAAHVTVFTVLNRRSVSFFMYTLNDSPDALTNLAKEADAYARRYVDAGLVVFAPETQSVARTESVVGPASGSGGLRGEAPFVMQLLPLALMLGIVWLCHRLWRRFRRRAAETASAAPPANDDTPGTTPPGA